MGKREKYLKHTEKTVNDMFSGEWFEECGEGMEFLGNKYKRVMRQCENDKVKLLDELLTEDYEGVQDCQSLVIPKKDGSPEYMNDRSKRDCYTKDFALLKSLVNENTPLLSLASRKAKYIYNSCGSLTRQLVEYFGYSSAVYYLTEMVTWMEENLDYKQTYLRFHGDEDWTINGHILTITVQIYESEENQYKDSVVINFRFDGHNNKMNVDWE